MNHTNELDVALTGDVSVVLTSHVFDRLKPFHPALNLRFEGRLDEAHAVVLQDILALAAAIAAVLSLLLDARKAWIETKDKEEAESDAIAEVNERLRDVKADGFEAESIEIVESQSGRTSIRRVVLRDIPDQAVVEVVRETETRFHVKRSMASRRAKKDSGS